jgi:chromosome segregation ATPase
VSQLRALQAECEDLRNKDNNSRSLIEAQAKEIAELKTSVATSELDRQAHAEALKAQRAKVRTLKISLRRAKLLATDLDTDLADSRKVIARFEERFDQQRAEIDGLSSAHHKLLGINHTCLEALTAFENSFREKSELAVKAQELRADVPPPPPPAIEAIPVSAWLSIDFPSELSTLVLEIANNAALTVPIKTRNIVAAVARYYGQQMEIRDHEIAGGQDQIAEITNSFDQFVDIVQSITEGREISTDMLKSDSDRKAQVMAVVSGLSEQLQGIQNEKDRLEAIIQEISSRLGVNSIEDVEGEVCRLKQIIEETRVQFAKVHSAARQRERAFKRALVEHRTRDKQVQQKLREQREQLVEMSSACDAYCKQQRSLENQVSRLASDCRLLREGHDERIAEIESDHRGLLSQIQTQYQGERLNLLDDIASKDSKIQEYSVRCQKLEEDLSHWKQTAKSLRKQTDAKADELAQLTARLEEERAEWQQQLETSSDDITAQSQQVISVLKAKNRQLRNLYSQTCALLEASEAHNHTLSDTIAVLEEANDAIQHELDSKQQEFARDQPLFDAKVEAIARDFDTKLRAAIAELATTHTDEKQAVFRFIADAFKDFFDASNLDETTFRQSVGKLAAAFASLRATDAAVRRLLQLGPAEFPEDAVARLMLS